MTGPAAIFDAALLRRRLTRTVVTLCPADFLLERVADDLIDRLASVQRRFTAIADLGTPGPHLRRALVASGRAHIVRMAPIPPIAVAGSEIVGDLEHLPFAAESLDLALSALALQTVDDLPGALVQIRRALKPDGLFLAAMLGGRTLHELRAALTEAEAEIAGGVSPRVAPFADVRDMGGLLQRAGFALPVADSEVLTVRYADLVALMTDVRAMGGANPLVARRRAFTPRRLFMRAAEIYRQRFSDDDGRLRATFEIVSLSGWAPHESQQKPARRGSGQISLEKVLGRPTAAEI